MRYDAAQQLYIPGIDPDHGKHAFDLLRERDIIKTELSAVTAERDKLREEVEQLRKERDLAEAKARWIQGVVACKDVSELACKLPPDILMGPLPFPDRIDYAAKMIQAAFDGWVAGGLWLEAFQEVKAERDKLREEVERLHEQVRKPRSCDTDEINRLSREVEHWRANAKNQAELRRAIATRPDLKERAAYVEKIAAERDTLRRENAELRAKLK